MSATAVSTAQASPLVSFYDDPFAAMNSVAASDGAVGDALESAGAFARTGRLDTFVEAVDPISAMKWQDHDRLQGMQDARADPLGTAFSAAQHGGEAMHQWVRNQLGVVKGAPLPFEVKLFQDGGFARGLNRQWNTLVGSTMQHLPMELRKAYEQVLQQEMHTAMQQAMLQDQALGEYTPVEVRNFSAGGGGGTHREKLDDATLAQAKALQAGDSSTAQERAQAEQAAALDMKRYGFDGVNAMKFAGDALDRQDIAVRAEMARPAIEFRIDTGSIGLYQNAKFNAAVDYAQQFAAVARGGIVAIAMGKDYARMWLAGELGFQDGQPFEGLKDDQPAPNSRALAQRWDKLGGHTLMEMPEFLREKYAPLANEVMQRGVYTTMHMDRQTGRYADVNLRDFTPGGFGEEYRYFLNHDGSLGREVIRKEDDGNCVDQILLPIINVALYFVPVVGAALGAAMTVATSIKNGVETGNWLGATVGAVAGVAGLGGAVSGLMGAAGGAMGGQLGTVTSALNTVANVGRVASGAYGLYEGIQSGNVLGAVSGGLGMVGGMSAFGQSDFFGQLNDNSRLGPINESIIPQEVQLASTFAQDGLAVYAGVESGNPMGIATGLSGALSHGAQVGGNGATKFGTRVLDMATNFAGAAMTGNQAGMSGLAAQGASLMNKVMANVDTDPNAHDAHLADADRLDAAAGTVRRVSDAVGSYGLYRLGQMFNG